MARNLAVRFGPGSDLRRSLEAFAADEGLAAAAIVTCVGSLRRACLRLADAGEVASFDGPFEIVSVVGTLSVHGCHVHVGIADVEGRVIGGHLGFGCEVYTTAEVVIAEVDGVAFSRELDPETGFEELVVRGAGEGDSRGVR